MKQLRETEQRSGGHRYRELGISDMEPADPIGGCDVSQRSRRQAAIRHELADADIEQHWAFVGPAPKPSSRQARGIHPAVLSKGGLAPALRLLANRSAIPATVEVAIEGPLPDTVEVGAYYIVAEALTNAAKHSHATEVTVSAQDADTTLYLSVSDNGVGGANPGKGQGSSVSTTV